MNVAFEPVMEALLARLVGAAAISFTAGATAGSAALTAPGSVAGLFPGLPVFGDGVADGCIIAAIAPDGSSITLSQPMTADTVNGETAFTTGFLTTGRRVMQWAQVSDQPALFLRRVGMRDVGEEPFTVTTLKCEAWIYCNAGQDPDIAPDSMLTCLEQLVRASLLPTIQDDDDGRCTLGGLAYWCRIEGESHINPGDQGPQAIAIIPILVTLP